MFGSFDGRKQIVLKVVIDVLEWLCDWNEFAA